MIVGQEHAEHGGPVHVRRGRRLGGRGELGGRQADLEPEGGALADPAVAVQPAAHQLDELAGDGQAQARAAIAPGDGHVGLLEAAEQLVADGGVEANAGVRDGEPHPVVGDNLGADRHFPGLGELGRVAQQVGEHLAQAQRIALHHVVDRRVDIDLQAHALLVAAQLGECGGGADHVAQVEGRGLERHLSRLDAGEVEHVGQEPLQGVGGAADDLDHLAVGGLQLLAAEEVGDGDDAVHRGADLVADVGQEVALGLVGGVGGRHRALQFGIAPRELGRGFRRLAVAELLAPGRGEHRQEEDRSAPHVGDHGAAWRDADQDQAGHGRQDGEREARHRQVHLQAIEDEERNEQQDGL